MLSAITGKRLQPRDSRPKEIQAKASLLPSWVWLIPAAILLPFANGASNIPMAAWLAPFFLLRFVRMQRLWVGLAVTYLALIVAFAFQFRGMWPLSGVGYYVYLMAFGIPLVLPYLADRLVSPRLDGMVGTLVFPTTFAAVEYLVSFAPYGTWGSIAYTQYGNLPLVQLLSVTGLWGLTFLITWFAAVGNWIWEAGLDSKRARMGGLVFAALFTTIVVLGGSRLALFPPSAKSTRVASLSQSLIKPEPTDAMWEHLSLGKASDEEAAEIRRWSQAVDDDLLARSEREAQAGAKIVFWGEGDASVLKEDESAFLQRGGELARKYKIYLGMALATWNRDRTPSLENKLVLVQPTGEVAWEYYKAHPVPGSEAGMSITRDGKLHSLETSFGRISSIICFDADFPRLLSQAGTLHTDVMLDPSNDWRAIDPWHTQMASFRAIEQGFNLVRQTDHGLSAAFDYQGRRLAAMDHYTSDDRVMIAQIPIKGVRTIYSLTGDWFAWFCIAAVLLLTAKGIAIAGKDPTRFSPKYVAGRKRLVTTGLLCLLHFGLCSSLFISRAQKTIDSDQSAPRDGISGRYEGLVKGASVGDLYITMQIKNDNGNITGTIVAAGSTLQITSGSYAENRLTVKFQVAGNDIVIRALYRDGKLVGNYTLGGETGTVELKRIGNEGDASRAIDRLSKQEWRDDLHYLATELPKRHLNAYHHITPKVFEQAVAKLDAAIPSLQADQIIIGMLEITAKVGDAHTYVHLPGSFHRYPLSLYWFGNELRVIRTTAQYQRALGTRVVRIGGMNIGDVNTRIRRVISQAENEWFVLRNSPGYIATTEVLHTLAIVPDITSAAFTFVDEQGKQFTLTIRSVPQEAKIEWLSLPTNLPLYQQRPDEPFWFTYLPEARTVYVNFKGYDSLKAKALQLFKFIDEHQPKRLVIDMRQNGGGDFTLVRQHLLPGLKQRPAINKKGHLFVVVGRDTFSAAMSNATDFRKETMAILVGEPIGERPNSYQENRQLVLPNSSLTVSYSTQYYKFLGEDVPAVMPDKRIDPDWASYQAGRDRTMEWILTYP